MMEIREFGVYRVFANFLIAYYKEYGNIDILYDIQLDEELTEGILLSPRPGGLTSVYMDGSMEQTEYMDVRTIHGSMEQGWGQVLLMRRLVDGKEPEWEQLLSEMLMDVGYTYVGLEMMSRPYLETRLGNGMYVHVVGISIGTIEL